MCVLTPSHAKPSCASARTPLSQAHYSIGTFPTPAQVPVAGPRICTPTCWTNGFVPSHFYKSHQRPIWQNSQESFSATQNRKAFLKAPQSNLMLTLSLYLLFTRFLQFLHCTNALLLTRAALPALW